MSRVEDERESLLGRPLPVSRGRGSVCPACPNTVCRFCHHLIESISLFFLCGRNLFGGLGPGRRGRGKTRGVRAQRQCQERRERPMLPAPLPFPLFLPGSLGAVALYLTKFVIYLSLIPASPDGPGSPPPLGSRWKGPPEDVTLCCYSGTFCCVQGVFFSGCHCWNKETLF